MQKRLRKCDATKHWKSSKMSSQKRSKSVQKLIEKLSRKTMRKRTPFWNPPTTIRVRSGAPPPPHLLPGFAPERGAYATVRQRQVSFGTYSRASRHPPTSPHTRVTRVPLWNNVHLKCSTLLKMDPPVCHKCGLWIFPVHRTHVEWEAIAGLVDRNTGNAAGYWRRFHLACWLRTIARPCGHVPREPDSD